MSNVSRCDSTNSLRDPQQKPALSMLALAVLLGLAGCQQGERTSQTTATESAPPEATAPDGALTPDSAKDIAKEAYLYAYPMVDNYLTIYQFAVDRGGDQYKGPFNQITNVARVFTPRDTTIVTANSDTPYSFLMMDLRREPIVVTLPRIQKDRYYSLHLVDLYTHNVDFIGTRKDGNDGGSFLIAGPDWAGETPAGIKRVVRIPTQLMFSQFRTQLYDGKDLENVKKIQAGYVAKPLSSFLKTTPPPAPPEIEFPPISLETKQENFWSLTNFLLQFAPALEGEGALRERMARIGVKPGGPWPPQGLSPAIVAAIDEAKTEAKRELDQDITKVTSSAGLFGTPQEMAGKYRERALGALGGIYGLSMEEAYYASYTNDPSGQPYDTGKNNYTLTFKADAMPPVDAFWSATMYDGKSRLMIDNPLDRYLINSPMLSSLKRGADGSLTLYVQHRSPGKDLESNWLPAPNGPMGMVMRLYLPKPEVIDGRWKAPALEVSGPATR